ncbi:MAG: BamA/TamA family outer membrane protein [Muribaculaceae bacterium]
MTATTRHIRFQTLPALAVAVIMVLAAVGCSTTRRIPEGEQLYTGIRKIDYNIGDSTGRIPAGMRDDIYQAAFVRPNNYWPLLSWRYPFPLGLWVYNNWPNPEKGLRHWLYEKLVEEPVLVSDVRPDVRTQMIEQILDNYGYFRGNVSFEMVPGKKNPRKASVLYKVSTGPEFHFRSVELIPDTTALIHLIDSIASRQTYLRPGSRYDTDSLSAARVNIANALRNRGYYYFRPEYIEYLADSVSYPGSIALRMTLGSNLPRPLIEPYRTGRVTVTVNRHNGKAYWADTLDLPQATLIKQMPQRLRTSVIRDNVTFRPGRLFRVRDMDRTQAYLSRLGIFSSVTIDAHPDTTDRQARLLDVSITCTDDKPLEASVEVNATSKSNSYLGPGLILGLTNRNIFGGGEQLSVRLNGSYEWQTGHGNRGGIFNSYEFGITGSLSFPRLLAPRFVNRTRREINWTRFTLNADILNRPHFFKLAQFNMAMSYDWQSNRYSSMSFTPLKLTYTKLMKTTTDFDSIMNANPAVALSFRSQYIPQMMYSYNFNKSFGADNRLSLSLGAQEAGNIFWAVYAACGKKGEKRLFGTPFSQFIKGTAQVVYSRRLGRSETWLVSRAAVGAVHPYGNSSQVPYAEQFYCGGANSVRAFTVRSIGPGSYRAPGDNSVDYFDQTGTFKFEANVELRFPIYSIVHGAVFLDSGNVWLLKSDPARPGGKLRGSTFFKDLALGTGVGLRFDISMLVLRCDLGIGLHAPYDTGKKGYYNLPDFWKSMAFHLAIGYPF